ncbi:hypothetical protein STCU_07354 [Strigomonas culicis]|uniref:Ubiquitin-like domain-containing protein n=1 Tax=Strigomonas culicis TaxID=28005 RepID=S9VAJ3_9TRYP|nr:hypothetical protein STCU_07354 [Strigomonas culicis]|eukprot:EPY24021.1 hypothetical protein STCU_07354 [Strigomonas culicis]
MLRRVVGPDTFRCVFARSLSISTDVRDSLTKHLSALKEECKGQALDLEDMRETARTASQTLQDAVRRSNVDDAKFKGKMTTLNASIKAYNTRLSNLQNESRSIQNELESVLTLLWGTEKPQGDSFATPPHAAQKPAAPRKEEDFDVEPPFISKVLESEGKPVEQVVAERVVDGHKARPDASTTVASEEIEVETIEIEVEPEAEAAKSDPVDTMKITDITQDLYEKGVNFSDCLDAQSLRQRYRDVLSGKIPYRATQKAQNPYTEPLNDATLANPACRPDRRLLGTAATPPNTSETGITNDPYPNAQRKMVDPMRYVHEIKAELALEKGIDANSVDLWSGKTKLEDHKRLYDYPSIQSYPIEVRQKGDIPR